MTPAEFKRWRKARGFTQAQAAEALGVSVGSIALYEAGHRQDGKPRAVAIPKAIALACAALAAGLTAEDAVPAKANT